MCTIFYTDMRIRILIPTKRIAPFMYILVCHWKSSAWQHILSSANTKLSKRDTLAIILLMLFIVTLTPVLHIPSSAICKVLLNKNAFGILYSSAIPDKARTCPEAVSLVQTDVTLMVMIMHKGQLGFK